MISEERLLELFAQDNPIPDVDELDLGNLESAAYLATLERRSSEVTRLDTENETQQSSGRRLTWLVAATVAVVVIGLALILANLGGAEDPGPVEEPAPTTLVESTPTTVAETTPSTAVEPVTDELEGEWDLGATTIKFEGDRYEIHQSGVSTDWGTWSRPFLPENRFGIMIVSSSDTETCSEGDEAIIEYGFDFGPDILAIVVPEDTCGDRGLGSVPSEGPMFPVQYSRLGTEMTGDADWDSTTVFVSARSDEVIPEGEYRTTRFAVPFRFTLQGDWVSFLPQSAGTVQVSSNEAPELDFVFKLFEPETVNDTVDLFTSRPELGTTEPVPATVGGAEGVTFRLQPDSLVTVYSDEWGAVPDDVGLPTVDIYVLDVGGRPVTIVVRQSDEGAMFQAMGQPLLDSIAWRDLG